MIRLGLSLIALLLICTGAWATTYHVGPGQTYATIGAVLWESLVAGDSVYIHWQTAAYHEKWVLCRVGTESAPIVVHGVPSGTGALPMIDGANATTRSAINFWGEERAIIKIGGANSPPDVMPAWIVIENLELYGARPPATFTGRYGTTPYAINAAAITIEKGQHITIRGCILRDCGNGLFAAYQTSDLLVERNRLYSNGNVGSAYEHNNYTEATGITFQYNYFGPLYPGANGNSLKDRSAGLVVRYNWLEGGNREIDMVDSDFPELIDNPIYRSTYVYGNILLEPSDDGNSQLMHYGGDSGDSTRYRQGTLYLYQNTIVSRRSANTTLVRLSTNLETCDARNNIIYNTATGNHLAMLDAHGTIHLRNNWLKTGWAQSFSPDDETVLDEGNVTGSDPGWANPAGDNFALTLGSSCVNAGGALSAAIPSTCFVTREYAPENSDRARLSDGLPDIGAYEYNPLGVAAFELEETSFQVSPNPFRSTCRLLGPPGTPVEILDLSGQLVATGTAPMDWEPGPATPAGIYVIRSVSGNRRVVFEPAR